MARQHQTTGYVYHDGCWYARAAALIRSGERKLKIGCSELVGLSRRRRCSWCGKWIAPEPTVEVIGG